MKFTKMHGAGNDYVYMDARISPVSDPTSLAIQVSDRHKGIGSDGLVLILPSEVADVRMRMFNSDGSESQMCGNAIRCVGKYAYENGLVSKPELSVETLAGIKIITLLLNGEKVTGATVDMGTPQWTPKHIPVKHADDTALEIVISALGKEYKASCVSMGNPHAVIELGADENLDTFPLAAVGAAIEHHPLFPERVNVEFIQVIDKKNIRMRVWERGAGETQACGTGACAVGVVCARLGRTDRDVTVHLLGGDLHIRWDDNDHIFMTGEAVTVFEGELL